MDVEPEGAKPFEHIVQILGIGTRKQGDLDVVQFDRRGPAKQSHAGYDLKIARAGAGKLPGRDRGEGPDELEVGGDDADFDFRSVS